MSQNQSDQQPNDQPSTPYTGERIAGRWVFDLIEGGNLLMMPGREAAPAGTKSDTPGAELEPAQINALIKRNVFRFKRFNYKTYGAERIFKS